MTLLLLGLLGPSDVLSSAWLESRDYGSTWEPRPARTVGRALQEGSAGAHRQWRAPLLNLPDAHLPVQYSEGPRRSTTRRGRGRVLSLSSSAPSRAIRHVDASREDASSDGGFAAVSLYS